MTHFVENHISHEMCHGMHFYFSSLGRNVLITMIMTGRDVHQNDDFDEQQKSGEVMREWGYTANYRGPQ